MERKSDSRTFVFLFIFKNLSLSSADFIYIKILSLLISICNFRDSLRTVHNKQVRLQLAAVGCGMVRMVISLLDCNISSVHGFPRAPGHLSVHFLPKHVIHSLSALFGFPNPRNRDNRYNILS